MIARLLLVAAIASGLTGCSVANPLPSMAGRALENPSDFELLSIDPDRNNKVKGAGFRDWAILGKTQIDDRRTREKLVSAFEDGVGKSDGSVALCFNPRHGMRFVHNGSTYEFLICFECSQVQWYIDGERQEDILIADSPKPVFDSVLKRFDLPLADSTND